MNEEDVLNYVQNLRLGDLRHLVRKLEDRLGVSAAVAPVVVEPEPAPEPLPPTALDLVLIEVGERRLEVIRALRAELGLALRQARDAVAALPAVVARDLDPERAAQLVAVLEAVGAQVDARPDA